VRVSSKMLKSLDLITKVGCPLSQISAHQLNTAKVGDSLVDGENIEL
jgi:hypothetical protein